jgi:hemerythrin-like metal-binding protein
MTALAWSDTLKLDLAEIDQTHQQFVALLNELSEVLASELDPIAVYARVLSHTEQHFAMEEDWMAATGFAADNCHSTQHKLVLDVMREVLEHARDKHDLQPMRALLPELVNWFPAHAEMMDAALVFHVKQTGYDPATGVISKALAQERAPISSCGSASCG